MNDNKEDLADELLGSFLNEVNEDSQLSSNFSHQVMNRVEETQIKTSLINKPIIPMFSWVLAGVFLLVLIVIGIAYPSGSNSNQLLLITEFINSSIGEFSIISVMFLIIGLLILIDVFYRKKNKLSLK